VADIRSKYRQSGYFGSAYRNGRLLADVVEVATPVQINRITVPAVGSADESYKKGRVTREGTLSIHKIDTSWELEVYALLSQSDDEVRAARDAGNPINPAFAIVLKLDDPEALGVERWQLDGCRIWNMTPGAFAQGDDITQRQYDLTWERETPLTAFKRGVDSQGRDRAVYVVGSP
jgi:hypothetical protein